MRILSRLFVLELLYVIRARKLWQMLFFAIETHCMRLIILSGYVRTNNVTYIRIVQKSNKSRILKSEKLCLEFQNCIFMSETTFAGSVSNVLHKLEFSMYNFWFFKNTILFVIFF